MQLARLPRHALCQVKRRLGAALLALHAATVPPWRDPPPRALPHAPAKAAGPIDLIGTRWIGVVTEEVDPKLKPRLEFVGGNRVSGYTGCNMMSGTWANVGSCRPRA